MEVRVIVVFYSVERAVVLRKSKLLEKKFTNSSNIGHSLLKWRKN